MRKRGGRKRALGTRAPMAIPQGRNQRWSLDFVSDTLVSGRRFRMLTVVDDFSRECVAWSWTPRSPASVSPANWIGSLKCGASPAWWSATTAPSSPRAPSWPGRKSGRGMALHRTGQADAEWLHRELQWPAARRVPQRASVRQPPRGREIIEEWRTDYNTNSDRTRASTGSHRPSLQHAPPGA